LNPYYFEMRYICIFLAIQFLLSSCNVKTNEISLAGEWDLLMDSISDPETKEISGLTFDKVISLPGTLDDAGFGDPLIIDTALTKEVMTNLKRKVSYIGPAYYSKEIEIPESWKGNSISLTMERVLWKSIVWIDDMKIGSENSLTTPHYYDLGKYLTPGKHRITICIDNRRQFNINYADLAHAYTNHTQIKWNGILGDFKLETHSDGYISDLRIFPNAMEGMVRGSVHISGENSTAELLRISIIDSQGKKIGSTDISVNNNELSFKLQTNGSVTGWSELQPELYTLEASLSNNQGEELSSLNEKFGFRNIDKSNGHIVLNGEKIFLRGTLECSIFPLTGHPPMEKEEWKELMLKARNYGLNHLRFHSWCPPEAAFSAADELGFYLQAELPNWSLSYGEDEGVVEYLEAEADRILKEYGNHPSFVMFCMGNELMGDFDRINGLVKRLKESDNRRFYAATAFTFQREHWGFHEPYDDYYVTQWTDSGWVRGQGVFDQYPPNFNHNYDQAIKHVEIPLISHEIGQYSVYPNISEIEKYTGVLSPINFMAVKKDLEAKGRLEMAEKYTEATGKFATILYKEEIERAYKTAGLSGFQLLDLHDFPGQGTALVGVLDAFWDSKGFTTGEEFKEFCSSVVPLLWFEKAVYTNNETLMGEIGLSNYNGVLSDTEMTWTISDENNQELQSGTFQTGIIENGSVSKLAVLEFELDDVEVPAMLTIELNLKGSSFRNSWQIWVYGDEGSNKLGDVIVTSSFEEAFCHLAEGEKVLLSPAIGQIDGIEGKFVPVFWSPVHFPNQPGTMGILCDPKHPVFNAFPTEFHSNWQWWDISKYSKSIDISEMQVAPLITVIDNFFKNRDLTNLFEVKVGEGFLVFSSIDLINNLDTRPASKQLLSSILTYMGSESFSPVKTILEEDLLELNEISPQEKSDILSIYN
jgi:hypothetical protein